MNDFKEGPPTPSSISLQEFLSQPIDQLEEFVPTKPITRRNFISWYKTSFDISKGKSRAQYLFFEWCKEHLGFDYKTTFKNFFKANQTHKGWNFLSAAEIEYFEREFKPVGGHIRKFAESGTDVQSLTGSDILTFAKEQVDDLFKGIGSIRRGLFQQLPLLLSIRRLRYDELNAEILKYVRKLNQEREASRKSVAR